MRGVTRLINYLISLTRALAILATALFLPQICLWNAQKNHKSSPTHTSTGFKLGVHNITNKKIYPADISLKKPSIALITNNTSTDQEGNNALDILRDKGITIKKILMPPTVGRKKTGAHTLPDIPLISLSSKKGTPFIEKDILIDIDTIMVDIQDNGMQYATSSNTLLEIMKTAAKYNKKCIILDRPNLLGGCMEGICTQLPLRYGMTIGEVARYYNKYILPKPITLEVIPMANYSRCMESSSMLNCPLSPEIKNINSCYGYSFLGLLDQVTPFDSGLGSDKAFQCILLPDKIKFPKQKWLDLAAVLKDLGIESKEYRYYNTRKKAHYSGLRLHIHDINHFSSFKTLLTILSFFKKNKIPLQFSASFDKAMGSPTIKSLIQGTLSKEEFALQVNNDLQLFFKKACSCFLYKPYPKMIQV